MPKPNILFIMTDNQGAWTLGCHTVQVAAWSGLVSAVCALL